MRNAVRLIIVIYLIADFTATHMLAAASSTNTLKGKIPALNPQLSPLAEENRPLLLKRIITTFDYKYEIHCLKSSHRNLADGSAVYHLRQELQALIDMWRATNDPAYLEQAKKLVFKAITNAKSNPHPLLLRGQSRGNWPCFFSKNQEKDTGGHGQLYDFQGSAGFMMVANALHQAKKPGWKEIADFVEKNIVEKWLFYTPSIKPENFYGPKSKMYLLIVLDSSRDKREHFATICMNLYKLGCRKYPYKQWANFLTDLYIGIRAGLDELAPCAGELGKHAPKDWGVIRYKATEGFVWYWTKNIIVQDTSHANRTVWLAARAYHEGLIDRGKLDGFINTLKRQVWVPDKGPFHFNSYFNARGKVAQRLDSGQRGNVWFGWHRLAAYDDTLKDLFISLAYDLTNGGPNIPKGAQNKAMEQAPLCLLAWAARLLSPSGQTQKFP